MGLLTGKFRQFLTELSVHDTIMAGYYRFMFYLDKYGQVQAVRLIMVNNYDSREMSNPSLSLNNYGKYDTVQCNYM